MMVTCQYCGKENSLPDALYCSSCGSSLRQSRGIGSLSSPPISPAPQSQPQPVPSASPTPGRTYGYGSTFGLSERYEGALAGVERMGTLLIGLTVVALLLIII